MSRTLPARVRPVLGYRTLPTTAVLVVIYLVTLAAIFLSDRLSPVPHPESKKLRGLDLEQARTDLEHIAARPHPYNSHANDAVREYLLPRLRDIAEGRDYVHIDDDIRSNGSWASANYGVYFEGTNLLVRIDGTEDEDDDILQTNASGAVLFSAHYDSVSTAPGATDDGMGVTTLLQLIEYFAINRTKRTAIFNLNNGEEDWLNGAHAFLQHPWSNLTTTFLNLEGAAAGGRPMLFRSTSLQALKAFYAAPHALRVRHPHGNVLSSDAFSRGVIRSGTDYSVYTGIDRHGAAASEGLLMEGLDVAFYKGRSRYHTKWDSPAYTSGGERSLWAMIDIAKGVGIGLLNAKPEKQPAPSGPSSKKTNPGVYFDLFKAGLVSFPLSSLLTFNIVVLIVGPILLALLWTIGFVLDRNQSPPPLPPKPSAPRPSHAAPARETQAASSRPPARTFGSSDDVSGPERGTSFSPLLLKGKELILWVWKQSSFWIALIATGALQCLLAWGYVALNPLTIYSRPYLVLLSFFSLAYLSIVLILKLAFPPSPVRRATTAREKEKTTILLHLHFLTWVILLISTIFIAKTQIGGVYVFTAWYLGVWSASVVGTLQAIIVTPQANKGKRRARVRPSDGSDSDSDDDAHRQPASERTPLLLPGNAAAAANGSSPAGRRRAVPRKGSGEGGAIGWWLFQVLLSVPVVVVLLGQIGMLLLDSMSQTLADGSSAWTVYILVSVVAVLLALPLAPFSPKLHRGLSFLALAGFICTTAYLWLVFPFTREDPLKVFFQQRVELDRGSVFNVGLGGRNHTRNVRSNVKITTLLSGTPYFLKQHVLPHLPSSRGKDVKCTEGKLRAGLLTCEWESGALAPHPGGTDPWGWGPGAEEKTKEQDASVGKGASLPGQDPDSDSSWLRADVTRTSWDSARIVVQGRNTRNCRLYFDSGASSSSSSSSGVKVVRYGVEGGARGMQRGYGVDREKAGLGEIRLWSRTWGRVWVVDVDWETRSDTEEGKLAGRVACEWAEYESGMVGGGDVAGAGGRRARIPALEEVLAFLPEWAVVSKAADGLVEVSAPFKV